MYLRNRYSMRDCVKVVHISYIIYIYISAVYILPKAIVWNMWNCWNTHLMLYSTHWTYSDPCPCPFSIHSNNHRGPKRKPLGNRWICILPILPPWSKCRRNWLSCWKVAGLRHPFMLRGPKQISDSIPRKTLKHSCPNSRGDKYRSPQNERFSQKCVFRWNRNWKLHRIHRETKPLFNK